ncbi:MAG TPA: hypothetical protein V6C81_27115 [Planktothrix sp.]
MRLKPAIKVRKDVYFRPSARDTKYGIEERRANLMKMTGACHGRSAKISTGSAFRTLRVIGAICVWQ